MTLLDERKISDIKSLDPVGDFIAEIMQDFCNDAVRSLNTLRETAGNESWQGFRDAAHALKSVAGSIGASKLNEKGSKAMRASDEELRENADKYHRELQALFDESKRALLESFSLEGTAA